jgi:porphobilinogen synthase
LSFPQVRGRRLRRTGTLRQLVRETELSVSDLIYPVFVEPGRNVRRPVPSMPGVTNFSIDTLLEEAMEARDLGIPGLILFGIPEAKDPQGSGGTAEDGIIPRAVAALKESVPGLLVITDVCLCEYTSHGHCGVLRHGDVDNDATLPLLARQALAHARAGADMVAPSDMMDGRVSAVRAALDEAGHGSLPIMAYSAKYASSFYGPFRDAAQSAPSEGDRRGYQMDPPNAREALREVALDVEEGADIVMVKPALAYLDVIRGVRERFDVPVAAYNVSGEYAMVQAAAREGWIDGRRAMLEILTSIKRAGADIILTYHAKEAARALAGPG